MELTAFQLDQLRAKQLEDEAVKMKERGRFSSEPDVQWLIAKIARESILEVNQEFNRNRRLRNRPRA